MRTMMLILLLADIPAWADDFPTLTFAMPNGSGSVGTDPHTGKFGVRVPYLGNFVSTVTSSATPLSSGVTADSARRRTWFRGEAEHHSGASPRVFGVGQESCSPSARNRVRNQPGRLFGFPQEKRSPSPESAVTRNLHFGGGLFGVAEPLIASDATHWYFSPGFVGIEDGIDLDNDGMLTGPVDVGGFSSMNFPGIGASTLGGSGSDFTLTMYLDGFEEFQGGPVPVPPNRLDAYFGIDPSTQWSGVLTLNFTATYESPGDLTVGWGGSGSGKLVETAVPEPAGILLLGTVLLGVAKQLAWKRFSKHTSV